jgi:uncharacterized protein (UPF0333 family)
MRMHKKAQSTLEYAIIIAVIVGALFAIQIYMKRGMQGKLRESTDSIGEQFEAGMTSNLVTMTTSKATTNQQTINDGVTTTNLLPGGETTEKSAEEVKGWGVGITPPPGQGN